MKKRGFLAEETLFKTCETEVVCLMIIEASSFPSPKKKDRSFDESEPASFKVFNGPAHGLAKKGVREIERSGEVSVDECRMLEPTSGEEINLRETKSDQLPHLLCSRELWRAGLESELRR